jgi:hypothetical protein
MDIHDALGLPSAFQRCDPWFIFLFGITRAGGRITHSPMRPHG